MSGKDERKIGGLPRCPVCKEIADTWSVGRQSRPVFWLRSKEQAFNIDRNMGWAVSFYSQRVPLANVIPGLNYVWCNKCSNTQHDEVLIGKVIKVALQLENTKYEVS